MSLKPVKKTCALKKHILGLEDFRKTCVAGFMTNQEKELFSAVPCNEFNTYWIPCTWFVYRIQEASKKGKLLNEYALETIMRVHRKIIPGGVNFMR